MAKTLLEKMFAKPTYKIVVLHIPEELNSSLLVDNNITGKLNDSYDFILAFYTKKEELEKEVPKLKNSLTQNGLLWIAYPKGKLLQTDLNRDILHELMKDYRFDGVSLVSLNAIWSAMRFKQI